MEFKFKVGDKIKRINSNVNQFKRGEIVEVIRDISTEDGTDFIYFKKSDGLEESCYVKNVELVNVELLNSKSLYKTMEKKIYNVLVVNKKTGKVDKNQVVSAENEQSAILKAFGVDVENVFIKIKEEGSYTEDKPVTAVLVKGTKAEPKA